MMEAKYLKINPADNVAVAITALPAGEKLTVDGKEITLNEDVPAGHKFALKDFAEGENVIKYGYPIGHTQKHTGKIEKPTLRFKKIAVNRNCKIGEPTNQKGFVNGVARVKDEGRSHSKKKSGNQHAKRS